MTSVKLGKQREGIKNFTLSSSDSKESKDENKSEKSDDSLTSRKFIKDTYDVRRKIGKGSFGRVYMVKHKKTGKLYAIKAEKVYQTLGEIEKGLINSPLYNESLIYRITNAYKESHDLGVPRSYTYYRGKKKEIVLVDEDKNEEPGYEFDIYLVMDLVGPNLGTICKNHDFDLDEIYDIAIQAINILTTMHDLGYVHRDIKPENFAYSFSDDDTYKLTKKITLLDFGLVKKWKDSDDYESNHSKKISRKGGLVGTARYMSINVHNLLPYDRRDDLESLGYVLLYLLVGHLPWQGLKTTIKTSDRKIAKKEHMELIKAAKIKAKRELCKELPSCFQKYMEYCWNLKLDETPNYLYLKTLFDNEKKSKKFDQLTTSA